MPRAAVALGMILLSVAAAPAADRFVAMAGSDGANDCLGSAAPCRSVGHAIGQAASGDEIKIAVGVYLTNTRIDTAGTLTLSGGWRRGFTERDANPRLTRLAGLYRDRVLVLEANAESIGVTLDRLTVSGGEAAPGASPADTGAHGGGILAAARNGGALALTLREVAVRKNRTFSFWSGGGLGVWAFDTSSVTVSAEDSEFFGNVAQRGAAIDVVGPGTTSISAVRTVFERNWTRLRGGAVALDGITDPSVTTLSLESCLFERNRAPGEGGAIHLGGQVTATIVNTVVQKTREGHGAINLGFDNPMPTVILNLVNSTVFRTAAVDEPNGLVVGQAVANVTNSILWGDGPSLNVLAGGTVNLDHSDVSDIEILPGGTLNDLGGNLSADPLFRRSNERDHHLAAGSPCIDTGTCAGAPATDFDGDARPTGPQCDIGADEFVP